MRRCELSNDTLIQPNLTAIALLPVDKLQVINVFIQGLMSSFGTTNGNPCIKPAFRSLWIVFVICYSIVWLVGVISNTVALSFLVKMNRHNNRFVIWFLINICVTNLIQCLFVLPLTILELLLYFWWFGEPICRMIPIFQTIPILVNVLSFLAVALDRYFTLFHQNWRVDKSNYRPILVIFLIWVAAICVSLPLRNYFDYVELSIVLGPDMKGLGICVVRFGNHIREMNVVLIVVLFGIPLIVIAYLMIKSTGELQFQCTQNQDNNNWHPFEQLSLNRIVSTLGVVFGVGWAPLQCFALINYVIPEGQNTATISDFVTIGLLLLAFGSATITPIILILKKSPLQHVLTETVGDRQIDDPDYFMSPF